MLRDPVGSSPRLLHRPCGRTRNCPSPKLWLTIPLSADESTTPPGSPPADLRASLGSGGKGPAPPANPAIPNILDTLASIARQNASSAQSNPSLAAPAPVSTPATAPVFGTAGGPHSSGAMQPAPAHVQAQPSMPFLPASQSAVQPLNVPGLPFPFPPPMPPAQAMPSAASGPAASAVPTPPGVASNPAATTVQLVAALAAQGIPVDKIASVIQMMGQTGAIPPAAPPQIPQPAQTGYTVPPPVGVATPGPAPWDAPRTDDARGRTGYHDGLRSPNRARGRSRSRSPPRWDGRGSPRSRANDRAFDYGHSGSPGRGRADDRYRQRSPRGRHGESSSQEPVQEKWVEYDNSLPSGCIRVYSRTLFVGGVT
jgi:protein NRD1